MALSNEQIKKGETLPCNYDWTNAIIEALLRAVAKSRLEEYEK